LGQESAEMEPTQADSRSGKPKFDRCLGVVSAIMAE
jgi:hypothetical protein